MVASNMGKDNYLMVEMLASQLKNISFTLNLVIRINYPH